MIINDDLLKKMFFESKEIIEKYCYTYEGGLRYAICKECGERTGAGALYRHKDNCKVGAYLALLTSVSKIL